MVRSSHRRRLNRAIKHFDGLLAYYPLNESSGLVAKNIAPDSVGTLNGTTTGATVGEAGLVGKCYDFSGGDNQVEIANFTEAIDGLTTITMIGLVYAVDESTKGYFGTRNSDVDDSFYILQLSKTELESRFRNSGGSAYDLTTAISDVSESWIMIALVLDGSSLELFLNGTSIDSLSNATGSIASKVQSFFIGREGNDNYTDGKSQHIAIFNKALSTPEILKLAKIAGLA